MQIKELTVSQFLADPLSSIENYTVFLINTQDSTEETLRVAFPETCNFCGNWFDLPAAAVQSMIRLGPQECCHRIIPKAALLLKPDQSQWIEMLHTHFSHSREPFFESTDQFGETDVCEADDESSFESVGTEAGELSGKAWVARFPTSRSLLDLKPPFLSKMSRFHRALIEAGATVKVNATVRPPERAYLMHWSFKIAKRIVDPNDVPAMPGVEVIWAHENEEKSIAAAQEMVRAYQIAFAPALTSNHIKGLAIDMTISWPGALNIKDATGNIVVIGGPNTGANPGLHQVGRSYGVIKLISDPPHWSDNGR